MENSDDGTMNSNEVNIGDGDKSIMEGAEKRTFKSAEESQLTCKVSDSKGAIGSEGDRPLSKDSRLGQSDTEANTTCSTKEEVRKCKSSTIARTSTPITSLSHPTFPVVKVMTFPTLTLDDDANSSSTLRRHLISEIFDASLPPPPSELTLIADFRRRSMADTESNKKCDISIIPPLPTPSQVEKKQKKHVSFSDFEIEVLPLRPLACEDKMIDNGNDQKTLKAEVVSLPDSTPSSTDDSCKAPNDGHRFSPKPTNNRFLQSLSVQSLKSRKLEAKLQQEIRVAFFDLKAKRASEDWKFRKHVESMHLDYQKKLFDLVESHNALQQRLQEQFLKQIRKSEKRLKKEALRGKLNEGNCFNVCCTISNFKIQSK